MDEFQDEIYEFIERHQTTIKLVSGILAIICLIGWGACENGLF